VHNSELEQTLARHLRPVTAPEELWDRVQNPRSTKSQVGNLRYGLAAAVLLLVAIVWVFHPRPVMTLESATASEIRDWVKLKTGLEIPLRSESSTEVRLLGASVDRGSAEIACRVGNHEAKLLVSRARSSPRDASRHRDYKGQRVVSWIMAGQFYTLACATPEDMRIACLLCHSDASRDRQEANLPRLERN
jgi:hypothetical protein